MRPVVTRHGTAPSSLLHSPPHQFRAWLDKRLNGSIKAWHRVPSVAAYVMQLVARARSTTDLRRWCENEFHAFLTCERFVADLLQALEPPPATSTTQTRLSSSPTTPTHSKSVGDVIGDSQTAAIWAQLQSFAKGPPLPIIPSFLNNSSNSTREETDSSPPLIASSDSPFLYGSNDHNRILPPPLVITAQLPSEHSFYILHYPSFLFIDKTIIGFSRRH